MHSLIGPLANHLWQSTLFALCAAVAAYALRRNRAGTRHWLWLAASVKFLIPFSLLVSLGSRIEAPAIAPIVQPVAVEQITTSFAPVHAIQLPNGQASTPWWPAVAVVVWIAGVVTLLARWFRQWLVIRAAAQSAVPLPLPTPIPALSTGTAIEPGVFGIFRPVLLLPEGITQKLSRAELEAILTHELTHIRRRDNLTAALHMLVETLFWFHPLVWWIGARLIEERERACDEAVLNQCRQPHVYAQGIINVCKFYLESPLRCASGVTGAQIRQRIGAIMSNHVPHSLTRARKLLLSASAVAALAAPIFIGIMNAPSGRAQSKPDTLTFEVASIRPSNPDSRGMRIEDIPGGGLRATGVTLKTLIEIAYGVEDFQITGGPSWFRSDRYDIMAKPEHSDGPSDAGKASDAEQKSKADRLRARIRALLAERFQLSVHRDIGERPVYLLTVAKTGHKLQEAPQGNGISRNRGMISGEGVPVAMLAKILSSALGRPVLDRTGIDGKYKFRLEWTEESGGIKEKDGPDSGAPDPSGPSIFTAIQQQLGLKLEPGKGPVEIIAIDRAEKPSAN